MKIDANVPRRRSQLILISAACAMLVLGLTLFAKFLGGVLALAYWLGCLALTLAAMLLALRDMRDIRRQNLEEKISLVEKAFDGVSAEVKEARNKRRARSAQ
jgi:hypothetical protein